MINTLALPSVVVALAAATTYTGTVDNGGTVRFTVSDNRSEITMIQVNAPNIECGPLTIVFVGNQPIVNDTFTYTDSGATFAGSFTSAQSARGTVQLTRQFPPACTGAAQGWSASAAGAPTPTPPPPPTPPTITDDVTPPAIALAGSTSQRARSVVGVGVTSNEPGSATATGTVVIRRSKRTTTRFGLRSADASLTPNVAARLRLRVPAAARRSIRRALRHGRRVHATLTVTVSDAAGNRTSAQRTVRLRRR